MKKIPSLFLRNYDGDRLLKNEVHPDCQWFVDGEGFPTRKFDGTCCLYKDGKWFKRHELKKNKIAPKDFLPAQNPDPITGDIPGWLPVDEKDYWHLEAINDLPAPPYLGEKTYELLGPKINGNPENSSKHTLIPHGNFGLNDAEIGRSFDSIKKYLETCTFEGIVWHHPDGRMCKVKRKDFFKKVK